MSIKNLFRDNNFTIKAHQMDADIMNVANFTTTDLSADNVDVNNVLYINNSAFPLNNVNMSADNTGNLEIHATGGEIKLLNTTPSISTSSGCLVLSGGVAIAGNENIAGVIKSVNTTQSTSTSTGALVLSGGLGMSGHITVGGNCRCGAINCSSFETDGLRNVSSGSVVYLQSSTTKVSGDFSTLKIGSYQGVNTYYDILSGGMIMYPTTSSANTTTGALQVRGGVGVGEKLNVNGITKIWDTTACTSASTGALLVSGGAGIAGAMNVGGSITTNQGIYLPTIGTTPSLLNYYVDIDGPYDYPTTGCIVASSLVVLRYSRIGGVCTLMWEAIPPIFTVLPGALTIVAGSIPARYRPGDTQVQKVIRVSNAGTAASGLIVVGSDGSINFYSSVLPSIFSATSEIQIFADSITYRV